jgi:hypothetical protein
LIVIAVTAVGFGAYRYGKAQAPQYSTYTTHAATVIADQNGAPGCIKLDGHAQGQATSCQLLWVSQSLSRLTLGERVQATYVDALVRDGEAFQGYVISPLGEPSG